MTDTLGLITDIKSLQERVAQLSKLLDVARFMSFERDLDRLLEFTARQVTDGLRADRCAIFLSDEKTGEVWSRVALGQAEEIRFPRGRGLAGHTIETGDVLIVPDAYADVRFNREIDEKTGYRTHNLMCVPLKTLDDRVLGCFQVVNKLDGDFTGPDQEYLVAFSSQAAVAIESAQLHREKERVIRELIATQEALQQRMRQLEIVYGLERSVNESEDFDLFMQGVIQRATEALDGEGGTILLLEESSHRILFSYRVGEACDALTKVHLEENEGIAGYVVSTGECVLENDVSRNPRHSRRIADLIGIPTRSLVAVPLLLPAGESDGERPIIGALEIINHGRGEFSRDDLAVLQIISAQVGSAIIRKRLLDARERSRRLATVGTLASTIIHDFKNPMSIIRGYAELLQRGNLADEKRDRYCRVIVSEVDRCVNMTKELLLFTRGEKNYSFELVPASTFFDELAFVIEHEIEQHGVSFSREVAYQGSIRIDVDRMKRAIFNLFNNAMEVLKPGDTFSISCDQADHHIEIRVADSGPGIPKEIRHNLFQEFVTHGKKGGTGLGLAIAKDVVAGHGGKLFLDPAVENGSTFVIQIPVPSASPGDPTPERPPGATPGPGPGRGSRPGSASSSG